MNGDQLFYSPLTDHTVLDLALQQAFTAGAAFGRDGDAGRWHGDLQEAALQRMTHVAHWSDRGHVPATYAIEGVV